jgi:3-oxoadipate enol-lactonase
MIETAMEQGSSAVANMEIAGLMGKTSRDRRPDVYDAMHRMMAQAPVEGIIGALEAMIERPDSTPTLATLDVPTLIIAGDEDVIISPRDARTLQAAIPGSRLEILKQSGHLSNVERPAAFNTVVSEFVGSLLYN